MSSVVGICMEKIKWKSRTKEEDKNFIMNSTLSKLTIFEYFFVLEEVK